MKVTIKEKSVRIEDESGYYSVLRNKGPMCIELDGMRVEYTPRRKRGPNKIQGPKVKLTHDHFTKSYDTIIGTGGTFKDLLSLLSPHTEGAVRFHMSQLKRERGKKFIRLG